MQKPIDILGHLGEEATRHTAKLLGWKLVGNAPVCEACAVGKSKQQFLSQISVSEPLKNDERRIHLDISTLKLRPGAQGSTIGTVSKPHWRLIVEAVNHLKHSEFFATKDGMIEPTCALLQQWKDSGRPVTHVCMDNAGENMNFMERCKSADWKLGIKKFELTARDTPQQNAPVEVGFATIGNRAQALMYRANVPTSHRHILFQKAILVATLLDGLVVENINGESKSRFEHATGRLPEFTRGLRTFGEAGVVKFKTSTTPKILNKGTTCMFVGYPENHSANCWEMYNPKTKGVHTTCDVVWLRRMYFAKPNEGSEIAIAEEPVGTAEAGEGANNNDVAPVPPDEPAGEDNAAVDPENPFPAIVAEQEQQALTGTRTSSGRRVIQPARYDPELGIAMLTQPEVQYYKALLDIGCATAKQMNNELRCVGAALGGGFGSTNELKPMKYQEAMATKDKAEWMKSVKEESDCLVHHKVFESVPRKEVPPGSKILSSTWAMKKKPNGKFWARVNARGYEQVDGEHYDRDSVASPTINIVTVRIILVILLLMKGYAHLVDVNGALLLGGWEHDPITNDARKVYMDIPEEFMQFLPPGDWLMLLLVPRMQRSDFVSFSWHFGIL